MTSLDLLVVACNSLEDTSASLPLKKAAVEALLSAASDGIALPPRAARLVWSFWTAAPEGSSWRYVAKIGDVPDERVRAEAITILERQDGGDDLRDLATDVLAGKGHAAHVADRLLLALAERTRDEGEAHRVARLIGAVHEARGIELPILRMVRDRWAASSVPGVRECSLLVAREIVEPDLAFVERMLADPDADVRAAMADALSMAFPRRGTRAWSRRGWPSGRGPSSCPRRAPPCTGISGRGRRPAATPSTLMDPEMGASVHFA